MPEEKRKDLNPEFQQERKDEYMADPQKNREAWSQKAKDKAGRDWTKPRRFKMEDGMV